MKIKFEKELKDYEERVVIELKELSDKIIKLQKFIEKDRKVDQLDHFSYLDLTEQLKVMKQYQSILISRINRF